MRFISQICDQPATSTPKKRFQPGRQCGVDGCKSTRYYKRAGQLYCKNDHLQVGANEYRIDEEETMESGMGTSRRQKATAEQDNPQNAIQGGELKYAIFLQAYQIILRHQAQFVSAKLAIDGYENVLRDLWMKFVLAQNLGSHLPRPDAPPVDDESGQADADEEASDLRRHSTNDESDDEQSAKYESSKYTVHRPVLIHSLALCYIALNLFRVPMTVQGLNLWVKLRDFPYIRAVRYLPNNLASKLSPEFYKALEPTWVPEPSKLWRWIQHTAMFLQMHTSLTLAPWNYRPVLFRMVTHLMLPLETFNATIATLGKLSLNLDILPIRKSDQAQGLPETCLLSVLLVVTKLLYSLDGVMREQLPNADPKISPPGLNLLHDLVKLSISKARESKTVSPVDVLSMTDDVTDRYLDWAAKTVAQDLPPTSALPQIPQGILDLFPLEAASAAGQQELSADSPDPFVSIKGLYGQLLEHPCQNLSPDKVSSGKGYVATKLAVPDPDVTTLFDDLVQLGALLTGITDHQLRKQISCIEDYAAVLSRK